MSLYNGINVIQYASSAEGLIDIVQQYMASKSWCRGGTGTRSGEDTDNSKFYYELAKEEGEKVKHYSDILYPEFSMNMETGHLFCSQGKGVSVTVDENNHVIIEV